ncbi:aldehyde dehydrogenase (NAD+) [Jatrophihabitans endophyticus]|uniref:Aldehyde dehydrogenase (NAD+) n=1 Tax=Jatrophihabitans endophyticus TaxID=1206085 RepID=A0A1M5PQK2_9ACTN|nr:aldehyde dehydrogenase family protein [Jatrophihabitans endophyticus]SHH04038.1 aldehyde dehydrogenase (NAD+) [Jatrophihabitans endophyticus]
MTTTSDRTTVLPRRLVIGSERPDTASGGTYEHVNPSTGRAQASVPLAGPDEVDRAVAAARAALPGWRRWNPVERRRVLTRFADLVREHVEELATIASLEMGAPITQTPYVVHWAADWLEEAAGWADRLHGETTPLSVRAVHEYTTVEPVGVVAALATWNGSSGAFGMTIGAPLAAGCTVVAKPSELAPFGAIRVCELALEAGVPAGVLNVITAGVEASQALVAHPGVDKITFTGSPATARRIAAAAAPQLTPCVFELGGKSASLVFDDADIDRAVAAAVQMTGNSGQVCTLGSRLLVHDAVHDRFVEQLQAALAGVRQGDPFGDGVAMGPVINEPAVERIVAMVDRARSYGTVLTGGSRVGGELGNGYFVEPTVVALPDNTGELARDEVFGPVVGVQRFAEEEEAVAIANDSDYGLAGYVFSTDLSRALRVAAELDTGNVGVNGGGAPAGPHIAFGGRKQSGYGKQGGLAGVLEFVTTKTVQVLL